MTMVSNLIVLQVRKGGSSCSVLRTPDKSNSAHKIDKSGGRYLFYKMAQCVPHMVLNDDSLVKIEFSHNFSDFL
jgi:hypothetical protein